MINMKRSVIIIIQILAVLLAAAGLSVLYIGSPNGYGISWMAEKQYEDTPQFARLFDSDLGKIKRLATLRDAFESEGEIALNKTIAGGSTENGTVTYTLGELQTIAQKFGCTMDPESHTISINPNASTDLENYELKLRFKTYDPYYYENLPVGPGQGIMTLKDLSIDAMQALAEYYQLRKAYVETPGNFYYAMHYLDEEDNYDDLQNTDKSVEEIRKLDKYAVVEGSGQDIDTNISPTPKNAFAEENYSLSTEEDEYVLAAGVDTTYPYEDRYQKAASRFEGDVRFAYGGIVMLVIGGLLTLISLVLLLRFDGSDGRAELMRMHPSDRMPYELFLFACTAIVLLLQLAFSQTGSKLIHILAPESQWPYWMALGNMLLAYGMAVYALCCTFRRYRKSELYQNSLLRRLVDFFSSGLTKGSATRSLSLGYAGFLLGNVAAVAFAVKISAHSMPDWRTALVSGAVLALLFVADCLVFVRLYRQTRQREVLREALQKVSEGETDYEVPETDFSGREQETARSINHISVGLRAALNEQVKSERLKADLITNVSHDIKTPLTSIINYVDLIKREDVKNPRVREYIEVLDKKSARLKNLTEDLLEASKASSGNVKLDMQKLDLVELAMQAGAEFDDKLKARSLELCLDAPDGPAYILADGRHLWRVLENLYNNAAKYAMEHTRIYAEVFHREGQCIFVIKNVSAAKLNVSPDELTERFVRGDVSRTTEGSGLGLSIAKSLTKLMGGELRIEIDGDLYKASVIFTEYMQNVHGQETNP